LALHAGLRGVNRSCGPVHYYFKKKFARKVEKLKTKSGVSTFLFGVVDQMAKKRLYI
jgi:hypothetical protein